MGWVNTCYVLGGGGGGGGLGGHKSFTWNIPASRSEILRTSHRMNGVFRNIRRQLNESAADGLSVRDTLC